MTLLATDQAIPAVSPAPAARSGGRGRRGGRAAWAAAFLACLTFAAATFVHFHDQQWNAYDDGAYLHTADLILQGKVLHRDVQDIHAGYINFANAYAMRVFGNDAVSLRYPLAALGVAGAALVFWLPADAGIAYAAAGSIATTCLSLAQFMNPSAHWYALFLALVTAAAMKWTSPRSAWQAVLLGFLVGLVYLFRQLTGVFVAMAVLVCLLTRLPQTARGRHAWVAKAVVALMALGLAAYLVRKTDPLAIVMFGLAPLAVLGWAFARVAAPNGDTVTTLSRFALGGVVSALPLLGYHAYHGSIGYWLDDTVVSAVSITELPFIDQFRYWKTYMLNNGLRMAARPRSAGHFFIGVFWALAPLVPAVFGFLVVRSLWRRDRTREGEGNGDGHGAPQALAPLTLLGVFYFLVALHFQKYMYFFFAFPLAAAGLLAMLPGLRPPYRYALLGLVLAVSALGFLFLAGPVRSIVPGRTARLVPPSEHRIPRVGLRLEEPQVTLYRQILDIVDRESRPEDAIFALPVCPEMYYLTGRHNPVRFHNSALDLHSHEDVEATLRLFERSPPRLVFYNPSSSYVTAHARSLMDWVMGRYRELGQYGVFKVYAYSDSEVR